MSLVFFFHMRLPDKINRIGFDQICYTFGEAIKSHKIYCFPNNNKLIMYSQSVYLYSKFTFLFDLIYGSEINTFPFLWFSEQNTIFIYVVCKTKF